MIPKVDLKVVFTRLQEFKNEGKKILGIFPHSLIPDELIYAANAIPVRLILGGDEYAATKGTEYMTQATCPFARGCIGYFDQKVPIYTLIDGLVGGNFCNGDLIASEIITKFFNIPFLKVTFPTTTESFSLKFLQHEYIDFKEKLEQFTGSQITHEKLISTFDKYNTLREAFQKINLQIKNTTSSLKGDDLQNLMHRFLLLGPDEILQFINDLKIENVEQSNNKIPILLSGTGIALGDELIHFIEGFEAIVMINDTWSGIHFYREKLEHDPNDDPMATLAKHYLLKNESSRMVPNVRRLPRVLELIKEYNIKGVIDHILKFCDPYIADYKRFKESLQDAEIPVLQLERDYSTSLEQLKTRIGAFFEMIL
ncbi:MAG: 2-hydroxyacyl-CoA dehydratase [Candidatus Helarchaeota archaeon]|nr:2-hydroxyacyl-CoA dehydratase [Candidatus Helarchaeota archaeon]